MTFFEPTDKTSLTQAFPTAAGRPVSALVESADATTPATLIVARPSTTDAKAPVLGVRLQ